MKQTIAQKGGKKEEEFEASAGIQHSQLNPWERSVLPAASARRVALLVSQTEGTAASLPCNAPHARDAASQTPLTEHHRAHTPRDASTGTC